MSKSDIRAFQIGFKRTLFALLTAVFFALGVGFLILTAIAPGYLAVLTFFVAVMAMFASAFCVYCQGLRRKPTCESQGEVK